MSLASHLLVTEFPAKKKESLLIAHFVRGKSVAMRVAFLLGWLTSITCSMPLGAQPAPAPSSQRVGAYTVMRGNFAGSAPNRYCASSGPAGSPLTVGLLAREAATGITWSLLLTNANWNLGPTSGGVVTLAVGDQSRRFTMTRDSATQLSTMLMFSGQDAAQRAEMESFINLLTANYVSITFPNQPPVRVVGPLDFVDAMMDLCVAPFVRPATATDPFAAAPAPPPQIGLQQVSNWLIAFVNSTSGISCSLESPEDAATGVALGVVGAMRSSDNVLVPGVYLVEMHDRVAQFPGVPVGDALQDLVISVGTATIPIQAARTVERGLVAAINPGTLLLLMLQPNWQLTAAGRTYRFAGPDDAARTTFQTCMQTVASLAAR